MAKNQKFKLMKRFVFLFMIPAILSSCDGFYYKAKVKIIGDENIVFIKSVELQHFKQGDTINIVFYGEYSGWQYDDYPLYKNDSTYKMEGQKTKIRHTKGVIISPIKKIYGSLDALIQEFQ